VIEIHSLDHPLHLEITVPSDVSHTCHKVCLLVCLFFFFWVLVMKLFQYPMQFSLIIKQIYMLSSDPSKRSPVHVISCQYEVVYDNIILIHMAFIISGALVFFL
jgi:hypothetical protein